MDDRLARYLAVLSADGHPVSAYAAELKSGQFHDVVLAGEVAYRFPRDEESRRRLPARVARLDALARHRLPVTIPEPLDATRIDEPVGNCYLAVRRVRGEPAEPGQVSGSAALVTGLAALLDDMARLGQEDEVRSVVPAAPPGQWLDWAAQVRQVLFPVMSPAGRSRAEAELTAVSAVAASGDALVHSDLGGANLLLTRHDSVPRVTGVLDWDEACIGNQASDLASLAVTFGWEVAELIVAARSQPDRQKLTSARLIAATFALQQALPAALSGDRENLDDGLTGYR